MRQLGATAITGALARANLDKSAVEQCWMGNVISAGTGQAPARQAARAAGLPDSTICKSAVLKEPAISYSVNASQR